MTPNALDDLYVSTILEDLFQYCDKKLCSKKWQYRQLDKLMRLKAAMIAFSQAGLAQRDEDGDPSPIMVPTKELMEILQTSRITTAVQPTAIPAIAMSKQEVMKYFLYSKDLARSFSKLANYFRILRPALFGCELGWVEHVRDQDGTLRWAMTASGMENIENGNLAQLAVSDVPFGRN